MVETELVDPLVGSMLGKDYRVLERIGVGGMAVVYLVEHQTLLKQFAAKVLQSEHATSTEARARFTQEAHAASQLDHENIVSISDFGITVDHRPYFVMELLRGKTLADRLDEGPMTLEEVVAVTVPAVRALAYAHAEGVVHRDVKPENIFLVQRSQGRWGVKVLDFGIAKVSVNDKMTKTGQALGSPMYMAPEACRGDDVDARADVYSFGILLYLMLAGRVPFSDDNILKILQMQVTAEVPKPRTFNPDLPPALEEVILRALAKKPEDRYPSMEALLEAFEAALPEGSDVLLLQAHFGASATPFPGSLERVRNSARSISMGASGNFFSINSTGKHNVPARESTPTVVSGGEASATARPTAPRKRGAPIAVAAIVLLGGGAAAAYMMTRGGGDAKVATTAPSAAPSAPTPVAPPPPAPAVAQVDPAPTQIAAAAPPSMPEPSPADTTEPPPEVIEPEPEPTKDRPASSGRQTTKAMKAAAVRTTAPKAASEIKSKPDPAPSPAVATKAPPAPASATTAPNETVALQHPQTTVEPMKPEPTPTPAPAPIERAPVTPTPAPAPAPKVDVGSLDATPALATLDVSGSLPTSIVRRSIERVLPTLRGCYQTAAKQNRATPKVNLVLRFEIDEGASARRVTVGGANFGGLPACARAALQQIQSPQAPDVGTVHVAASIRFTPT